MIEKQNYWMRWILFSIFVLVFAATSIGTLGMVFLGWGSPQGSERTILISCSIGQTASSVVALFYFIFGLKKSNDKPNGISMNNDTGFEPSQIDFGIAIEQLKQQIDQLECSMAELRDTKQNTNNSDTTINNIIDRILGVLGAGESLSLFQLERRLAPIESSDLQRAIGILVDQGRIQKSILGPSGSYQIKTRF